MDIICDWLSTFGLIIIKPLPKTYKAEASKAKGKFPSAVAWLAFYAIALHIHVYLQTRQFFSIFTILATILVFPIDFLLFIFCIQLLCGKMFDRKKDYYDELLYLTVGNFIPFIIIDLAFASIPQVSLMVSWATLIYPLILTVIMLKTLTQLKLWQSIVTIFLASLLAATGFLCIGAMIFGLMRAVPGTI